MQLLNTGTITNLNQYVLVSAKFQIPRTWYKKGDVKYLANKVSYVLHVFPQSILASFSLSLHMSIISQFLVSMVYQHFFLLLII